MAVPYTYHEKLQIVAKNKRLEDFPETFGHNFMQFPIQDIHIQLNEKSFDCEMCMKPVLMDQKICDNCFLKQNGSNILSKRSVSSIHFSRRQMESLIFEWNHRRADRNKAVSI